MACVVHYFRIVAVLTAFVSLSTCGAQEKLSGDVEYLFTSLGPHRSSQFYAGDTSYFRVPIKNFLVGEDGFASLQFRFEIRKGDELVAKIADDSTTFEPTFGSRQTSLNGHFRIPVASPPGVYHVAAIIKDRLSGASVSFTKEFAILEIDRPVPLLVRLTTDENGIKISSGRFVPGESVFLHFSIAGIETLEAGESCQCEISFFTKTPEGVVQVGRSQLNEVKRITGPLPVPVRFMFTTEPAMRGFARLSVKRGHNEAVTADIPFEVLLPLKSEPDKAVRMRGMAR